MLFAAAAEGSHLGQDLVVLGVLFVIAYGLGRLGKLIGLPTIPVYMIVGLLASPYSPWFPLNFPSANVELIAVFGLVLLLFNLGLEFDQDEFVSNAGKLIVSGGSYILVNMAAGLAFGFLVGWGTREALIIAGITATSSSAIVTKLLIELGRLTNRETPMILGVTVVEDIFIAIYLAIVGVVLSGETELWLVIGKLAIAFTFIIVMFAAARFGGKIVSRVFRTKDDELFTILFFGLAVAFGGVGELLGVTDAIGAFLIGLVLGATRFRNRIEHLAVPLRDIFGAFFFLNFGLALDPSKFGGVIVPVVLAVLMTVVLNAGAGQFVAWLNKLGPQAGINAAVILQNRGEFALILATLSLSAGLDARIQPFAGLYVLIMAVMGPIVAARSERIGAVILRTKQRPKKPAKRDPMLDEEIALMEAATSDVALPAKPRSRQPGKHPAKQSDDQPVRPAGERGAELAVGRPVEQGAAQTGAQTAEQTAAEQAAAQIAEQLADHAADQPETRPVALPAASASQDELDRLVDQAMQQSDEPPARKREPDY